MWQLAFAGASAAAGLFSAYDGFNANRHILRDLNKIKQYLKELKKATNELKTQNELILKKLDELPEKIRQIVSEVIDLALLREPYSDIADVYENFLTLTPRPVFRKNGSDFPNQCHICSTMNIVLVMYLTL